MMQISYQTWAGAWEASTWKRSDDDDREAAPVVNFSRLDRFFFEA